MTAVCTNVFQGLSGHRPLIPGVEMRVKAKCRSWAPSCQAQGYGRESHSLRSSVGIVKYIRMHFKYGEMDPPHDEKSGMILDS